MTIYVSNLSSEINEMALNDLFSRFGEIRSIRIMKDAYSGESKGVAFIEMPQDNAANKAIQSLHSSVLYEKTIIVQQAKNSKSTNNNNSYKNKNYNY